MYILQSTGITGSLLFTFTHQLPGLKRKWKRKEMREQPSRGTLKNQCSETSGTFLEIMLKVSAPDLPPTTTYK